MRECAPIVRRYVPVAVGSSSVGDPSNCHKINDRSLFDLANALC